MRTRLWTWWDTLTLVVYEGVAIVIALIVPATRQLPVFIGAMAVLALVMHRLLRHTQRGARIRASLPSETESAPLWLMFLAGFAIALPLGLLLHALGAGDSYGWTMIAGGSWIVSFRIADRWWTARAGAAA